MTIITKANTDKKLEKLDKSALIIPEISDKNYAGRSNGISTTRNNLNDADVEMWLSPSARRRISTTTTVCVFITVLIVMSICIIGGVYLYRQVTQHQRIARFRGWCGIPYERDTLHFGSRDYLLGPNKPFFKENNVEWLAANNRFKEEFELDLENELYERIDVPDFGYGRKGRFIHDFEANKTGIIDLKSKRCFVIPLDRKHVKRPRSLFDLISQLWMGYYMIDTKVIRRTMRVVQPPITDLKSQGTYIAQYCAQYPTFLLKKITDDDHTRYRREATTKEENFIRLAEFAGSNIIEFTILENE